MKDSEFPKSGKVGRSGKESPGLRSSPAVSDKKTQTNWLDNVRQRLEGAFRVSTATEEGMSPLGNSQASGLSTEAVARPGNSKLPVLKGGQDRAEFKFPASYPDVKTSEALDADKVGLVKWTATTSDEEETDFYEEEDLRSCLGDGSVHEQVEGGILDGYEARAQDQYKDPTETISAGIETLMTTMSRHTTQDKLAVMRSQVLDTLSANKAGQFCASLEMQWDILGFMEDQYRENDLPNSTLGLVMTLSGSAQHAQATTCSEYIRQNWPTHGSEVLDTLQNALNSPMHTSHSESGTHTEDEGNSDDDVPPSNYIKLDFEFIEDFLFFYITSGTPLIIVEVVQQLAWMGAALRTSRDGRVQYCESTLERSFNSKGTSSATFNVVYDTSPLGKEDQSCWLPLFTNPVIAHGFPTATRNNHEVGLEIPLDMMAALGGARHAVDFEGGLVLKGYSTLFVPIKCRAESVQWHLIRASGDDRISYREASVQCPNRVLLKDLNHEALKTTRAYLGWWKKAETHLGTAGANYKSIDWSPAGEAERPPSLSSANIGFQSIVTGQLHFIPGAKDGRLHFSQKGPFQRIVQRSKETPVALYDVEDRRGWLVPALDVMLHIVQTRHHSSPYNIDGRSVELTPVIPEQGIGAASEAAAANQMRQLYERDVTAEKDYYYKDVLLDTWSQMDLLMEKEDSMKASPGLALHGTMQSKVHGWEYMSLVHEKNFWRKEAKVQKSSGGWVDLIKDVGP